MKNKLIIIAGPTAVGKTEFSIKKAYEVGGEIISLDSVQVYKYFDIGSAKIKKEEMQDIKHYMIDEFEPTFNANVSIYKDRVNHYIDKIYQNGNVPILVGGTGFYIHSILYNNDFLYEDDDEAAKIRNELYDLYKKNGVDYIFNILKEIDYESSLVIPKENVKRVIRAIEFYRLHNFKISTHNENEKNKTSPYDFTYYVLRREMDNLYERINKRVDIMVNDGFLIEVIKLMKMGLNKNYNSMKSIGYSELYDFVCETKNNPKFNDLLNDFDLLNKITINKQIDNETENDFHKIFISYVELIKQHSRNYAKRQMTWYRKEKDVTWVSL